MTIQQLGVAVILLLATMLAARVNAQDARGTAGAGGRAGQPAILLLAADDEARPWVHFIVEGFREMALQAVDPPALYFETLDAARFTAPGYLDELRTWLGRKYRGRRVDLVVTIGEDALYFLADAGGAPWPNASILYFEAGGLTRDIGDRLPQATGVLMEGITPAQLAVIKQVLPDTARIVLVQGPSPLERTRAAGLANAARAAPARIEPVEVVGLSMDDLLRSDDKRAGDVVRRVRTLLRKRELEMRAVDVNDVARETLAIVAADAADKSVRVEAELSPTPCIVLGDSVHLQQVLLNLALNGIEAMAATPSGRRRLHVRTTCSGGEVEVAVADTGTGIPSEAVAQVFEPFFTTKREGMGMGLSIARTIVDAHGGRLAAENNPAGGATIRLRLPAAAVA